MHMVLRHMGTHTHTDTLKKLIETRNYWQSPPPAPEKPSVSEGYAGSRGTVEKPSPVWQQRHLPAESQLPA